MRRSANHKGSLTCTCPCSSPGEPGDASGPSLPGCHILLPCQERPTTPKPSRRCPAAAFVWSPITAKVVRGTALSWWPGAACGGRRTAAATELRLAKGTDQRRSRIAARPPSVAGRPGERPGAGTPGRLATPPHRPRVRSNPRSQPRRPAAPRREGAPGGLSTCLEQSCTERSGSALSVILDSLLALASDSLSDAP
jgi:hypothetical protein